MLRSLRVCLPFVATLLLTACAEPPSKEMNQAQGALDAARAAGAETYAAAEFAAAADALQRSHDAVAQNDYRLALSHAIDSRERAQQAARAAVENRAKARGDAERIVAEANTRLTVARTRVTDAVLAKLPRRTAADLRNAFSAADKTMQEARAALERDDLAAATRAAETVSAQIQESLQVLDAPTRPTTARKRR